MINKLKHELDLIYSDQAAPIDDTISVILCFNERPFTTPPPLTDGVYWRSPQGESRLLALNSGWSRESRGRDRFRDAERQLESLTSSWGIFDPEENGASPRLLFQYAFSEDDPMENEWHGFPNTLLLLPRLQLINQHGRQSIIFSHETGGFSSEEIISHWKDDIAKLRELTDNYPPVGSSPSSIISSDQSLGHALPMFREAITAIQSQDRQPPLEKLVLGEQQRFHLSNQITTERTLKSLERSSPTSAQFAFCQQGRCFIAAPPERLFLKKGRKIYSDALAGTLPRGDNRADESRLSHQLVTDPKLHHEHQLVVDATIAALTPLCSEIDTPPAPVIRKLDNIQHLLTSIEGRLQKGDDEQEVSIFDLIAKLHQSPAICGSPKEESYLWLQQHHNSNRGGYCGGAGWIDPAGDGEIHVLLRCAMVEEEQATLYAGAGIVDGSVAEDELSEIRLKIQGMLNALSA